MSEVAKKKGPNRSSTDRLRVRNLVSEQTIQYAAVRLYLRISKMNPLFDEGLFFGGSTQQGRGIWIAACDN